MRRGRRSSECNRRAGGALESAHPIPNPTPPPRYDVEGNVLRTKRGDGKDGLRSGFDQREGAAKSTGESDSDDDESDASSDALEEWTAGVFPGCGHIVTFSADMQRGLQACPLCRDESQLQMLSISYEPAITNADTSPSHVFNPCGCAASLSCVKYWADLKMPHNAHPG